MSGYNGFLSGASVKVPCQALELLPTSAPMAWGKTLKENCSETLHNG
jgi:hypothetical protein